MKQCLYLCIVEFLLTFVLWADDQAGLRLVAPQLVLNPALVHTVHLQRAVVHVQARVGLVRRDLHPLRLFQLAAVVKPGHLGLGVPRKASIELCAGSLLDPVRLDLLCDLRILDDGWKKYVSLIRGILNPPASLSLIISICTSQSGLRYSTLSINSLQFRPAYVVYVM